MASAHPPSTPHSTSSSSVPTPSLSSSATSSTKVASAGDHIYKGKYTNRSWQQLPPELVRTIATHYLLDVAGSSYCPLTWDAKELWHARTVYTTFRDANALEKLMQVTPTWAAALEAHLFWNKACAVLDPHDVLAHYQYVRPQPLPSGAGGATPAHPQQTYRITPYRHFRQMTGRSCFVCRINSPFSSVGLAAAKRTHNVPNLGPIALCRDHRKTMFCGLCLREAPPAECDPQFDIHGNTMRFTPYHQPYGPAGNLNIGIGAYNPYANVINPALMVCCAENEDEETWPGTDTTCRACRSECLWQRISISLRDREAVGGPRFLPNSSRSSSAKDRQAITTVSRYPPAKYASADWETRQTVDAFIELGEGSISEVIAVAREKFWLGSQTKMPELMEQAVAATRWAGEGMGVDFAPHTPAVNQHRQENNSHLLESSCCVDDTSQEAAVGNDVADTYSTSPSPPSPRSAQRSRSPSPRSVYSSEYEGSEEEEDPELLSLTEDAGGVRELAISDWARTRILDGHWCSPADQWYGYAWPAGGGVRDAGEETESEPDPNEELREGCTVRRTTRVEAVHPCPLTISSSSPSFSLPSSPMSEVDDIHPRSSTVRAQVPPSFALCEQAFRAYQKQLRLILLPPMNNLVRKFVIEYSSGIAGDPAVRAARMELEEVLAELRTPGVWFDGVDWAAGGLVSNTERERQQRREREREREEDSASSASSRSDGSHTTSPVLSTTTLQTTPSPPPAHNDDKDKEKNNTGNSSTVKAGQRPPPVVIPIPVSPVLESPRLIHPVPYVPVTLAHMAQYSLEAFKIVWREACGPLFHCRCTICERAMIHASAAAGHAVPSQAQPQSAPPVVSQQPQQRSQQVQQPQPQPTEIALEEVRIISREHALAKEEEEEEAAEEEELYEEEEEEEEEEDEESEDDLSSLDDGGDAVTHRHPPVDDTHTVTPRKRSSGDLEADCVVSAGGEVVVPRVGTPPKRARTGAHVVSSQGNNTPTTRTTESVGPPNSRSKRLEREGSIVPSMLEVGAPRQRKRSSEELELSEGSSSPSSSDGTDQHIGSLQKRLRVESSPSGVKITATATPRSLFASPPSSTTVASASPSEEEDKGEKRGYVDVGLGEGDISTLKTGLVNGGELDGLYVFEET